MKFREFVKTMSFLLLIIAGGVAVFVWSDDRPTDLTYQLRLGTVVAGVLGIAGIAWAFLKTDKAPDYLCRIAAPYFDRGGFCFLIRCVESNGQCHLQAIVQNRHERRCRGQIAMRPEMPLLGSGPILEQIAFAIDCPPAGFGIINVPISVPTAAQGKQVTFQVGASVDYPEGRGCTLRFKEGIGIRSNSDFRNAFGTTLTVLGAMGGAIVLSSPASVTILLPNEVSENVNEEPSTEILWELGDPLLTDFV